MAEPLGRRLDHFNRRHPRLMFGLTVAAALATTILLLAFSQNQKILYKAF